jgi:hypothetical protein
MDSQPEPEPSRFWATAGLIAGGLWLALSLTPLPFTTILGLPVAAISFGAAWLGLRQARQAGDRAGSRRAVLGLGLGCAGCLWQVVYYSFVGAALVVGLPGLVEYLRSVLGTPTPLP